MRKRVDMWKIGEYSVLLTSRGYWDSYSSVNITIEVFIYNVGFEVVTNWKTYEAMKKQGYA